MVFFGYLTLPYLTCILISSAAPFGLYREESRKEGRKEGGQNFRARETAISLLFDAFKAAAIGAL